MNSNPSIKAVHPIGEAYTPAIAYEADILNNIIGHPVYRYEKADRASKMILMTYVAIAVFIGLILWMLHSKFGDGLALDAARTDYTGLASPFSQASPAMTVALWLGICIVVLGIFRSLIKSWAASNMLSAPMSQLEQAFRPAMDVLTAQNGRDLFLAGKPESSAAETELRNFVRRYEQVISGCASNQFVELYSDRSFLKTLGELARLRDTQLGLVRLRLFSFDAQPTISDSQADAL